MPRVHFSPVLGKEILIIEKGPISAYRKKYQVWDKTILTDREVQILRQMEREAIRIVGMIKDVFPDCEVTSMSEEISAMFPELHLEVSYYPDFTQQMSLPSK
jgi:hypothetical protein